MATINSSAPSANRHVRIGGLVYNRVFMLFALPNLSGGTPTAAVLHLNCNTVNLAGVTGVVAHVSENVTWDETSDSTTLDALTMLGASMGSVDLTSIGDKTWDITGTTEGIIQAYSDGAGYVTVRLRSNTTTAGTAYTPSTDIWIGDDTSGDISYLDGRSGATPPYIVVTYTPGATYRPKPVMINGIMA